MRRGVTIAIVIGWLLGAAMLAGWVTLSGGWYEYHIIGQGESPSVLVNQNGWEPVPGSATVPPGYSLNYRRPRFLAHTDAVPREGVATPPQTPATAVRTELVQAKVAALTVRIRSMTIFPYTPGVISRRDAEYEYAQGAYVALDTELAVHDDHSRQTDGIRTLLGPLKEALDKVHTSNDPGLNDALVRQTFQLDHVAAGF